MLFRLIAYALHDFAAVRNSSLLVRSYSAHSCGVSSWCCCCAPGSAYFQNDLLAVCVAWAGGHAQGGGDDVLRKADMTQILRSVGQRPLTTFTKPTAGTRLRVDDLVPDRYLMPTAVRLWGV